MDNFKNEKVREKVIIIQKNQENPIKGWKNCIDNKLDSKNRLKIVLLRCQCFLIINKI